jgi:undecaprenyl-diphosphatase
MLLTLGVLLVIAVVLGVAAIFSMVVGEYGLARLDLRVAEYGRTKGDAAAFDLYRWFTHFGGTLWIVVACVLAAAWGWWRYRKADVALYLFIVVLGQSVVSNGLKLLVGRDRPDLNQLADWSGSSFPSGHSAAAAAVWPAIALVLTLRAGKIGRTVGAVVAAMIATGVGATRALLGVHWFTDVVAGLAVGFGWFVVCTVVFGGRIMRFGEPVDEADAFISDSSSTVMGEPEANL